MQADFFHCFLQTHAFCFSHSQASSPPIHLQGQNKAVFMCSCWVVFCKSPSCLFGLSALQDYTGVKVKEKEM